MNSITSEQLLEATKKAAKELKLAIEHTPQRVAVLLKKQDELNADISKLMADYDNLKHIHVNYSDLLILHNIEMNGLEIITPVDIMKIAKELKNNIVE